MLSARCVVKMNLLKAAPTTFSDQGLKDAVRVADEKYRAQAKTIWATQGAASGTKWKDLDPKYKRWKAGVQKTMRAAGRVSRLKKWIVSDLQGPEIKAVSTDVLVLHGNMRRAFAYKTENHIAEIDVYRKQVRITLGATGPEYWGYHARGEGNNPKRDPNRRTDAQKEEIKDAAMGVLLADFNRRTRPGGR